MRPKTKILAATGIAALVVALVTIIVLAGRPVYTTESAILAQPFTNAFFVPSFERKMLRTCPGAARVSVLPAFDGPPGTKLVRATNGAAIRIRAVAPTAERAIALANDAMKKLSETVSTNYGVKVYITEQAKTAHSCPSLLYVISSSANSLGNR